MTNRNSLRSRAAVRELLDGIDQDRVELRRDRENAIRSGDLDSVLKFSKDLRLLHRDYLEGGLKATLIQHAQFRQRNQHVDPEWPQYEAYERIFGREVANTKLKEWKAAKTKEAAQESSDPVALEKFTTEYIRDDFLARMEGERKILENLKRVAQQERSVSLVRAYRNELRLLRKELLEGQMEINNFERDNPPPVNPYAKTAEIVEARDRFIELVRELAEKSGVIAKSEET